MEKRKLKRAVAVCLAVVVAVGGILVAAEKSHGATIYGTVKSYNRVYLTYSTSTSGNYTTISWALYCTRTSTSYKTYKKQAATSVVINGSTVYSGNTAYDVSSGGKLLCSGSTSVYRSNGAAKSVAVSASCNLSGTSVGGNLTLSGTISLPAYTVSTTSKTVTVDWIDNGNLYGARPETVPVTILRNGSAYSTKEVSTETNSVSFTGLPTAYGGTAYTYTVKGTEVDGYLMSVSGNKITYIYGTVPEEGFRMGFSI